MESTKFVSFFCEHVLRRWEDITAGDDASADCKLDLLKIFAEMTEHCGELEKSQEKIDTVYNVLMVTELPLNNF